jgi:hypothetical protein
MWGVISGCADMAKNTHVAKSLRSFPLVLSAKHALSLLISLPWAEAIRNDIKNTKKARLMAMIRP